MSFDTEVAIAQIDSLLQEYELLQVDEDQSDHTPTALAVRMKEAVIRLSPRGSDYRTELSRYDGERNRIRRWVGYKDVLLAMRADFEAGWLATVEELIHAETFADFLDMAKELLDKGYKDAAAVIAGSVLENQLRTLALRASIEAQTAAGAALKADRITADLVKADVFNKLQQTQVTAWLGLRNKAAHGEYDEYDHKQVASLIDSIRDFILKYPA